MHAIGLIVYPGFQVLSLSVASVFEYANLISNKNAYAFHLVSESGGPVVTSQGFSVITSPLRDTTYGTLIMAGGNDLYDAPSSLTTYLQAAAVTSRRVTSICTGAFVLGQAGLLDSRHATTHWQHASEFRRRFPQVRLEEDRIFVVDGPIWTSAGMTAGVDLALAIVEQDLGLETARSVARKLVLYQRRGGGQSQFSALLDLDAKSDRIRTVLNYAKEHLKSELSVDELAAVANISPRQFSRVFRAETGQSPARAIERLRVEAARGLMETGRHSIDVIARETGFSDRAQLRQAFLRAFGQSPRAIQKMSEGFRQFTVEQH